MLLTTLLHITEWGIESDSDHYGSSDRGTRDTPASSDLWVGVHLLCHEEKKEPAFNHKVY